jgi:hypothetical protein
MSIPEAADPVDVGSSEKMMFDGGFVRGSFALLMLLVAAACSVVNKEHCGNLEGNATCLERDPGAPYCSICVAENNGCLAEDPGDSCLAETAAPTGADGSETSVSPTTGTTTSATTDDPSTGVPATTTTPGTTSTGDESTSTTDPTGPATEATTTTTTTTSETTGSDTTETGGPVCGNNKVEGDEVCDGTDLNEEKCQTLLPDKWGGGTLMCNNCSSYNDTNCCIGVGQACSLVDPDGACCDPLSCKMDGLMTRCLN